MDLDFGAVVQSVAILVALLGVIASFFVTRRGQRQDLRLATAEAVRAERAERAGAASAQRAENAAALTIDTLTRIAEALETLAAAQNRSPAIAAQPRRRPSWSLRSMGGDAYALENTADVDVYDVQLSSSDTLRHVGAWPAASVLRPRQTLDFRAQRTPETTDSTITVEYATRPDSENRDTWRYPLPMPAPASHG